MKHHCTSPLSHSPDRAFGDAILMMGADARIVDLLALMKAVLDKVFGSEWGIVGMVLFDVHAVLLGPLFKRVFSLKCFTDAKGDLMVV
jgi:hypothetical protein